MAVFIRRIRGEPRYDAIPVAKITDYPLEKGSYKPFAQCQMCVNENGLHIRLWAFEVHPPAGSALRLCLTGGGPVFRCTAYADGRFSWEAGQVLEGSLPLFHHPFAGEDQQGEYWGVSVLIPDAVLPQLLAADLADPRTALQGNLYKISDEPGWAHFGSHFPVDAVSEDRFGPQGFGPFEIINY